VANPSVVIDIAAEYTGKKAFDKASKSTNKLEGAVASLAKKMAVAFSVTALLKFGKNAVKAFADDEKSAAILANTMKNLGLQFQNPAVEAFITKMQATTGELEENLRPAMQKLLQVTGSVSQSQELLTLALDVAAGSGVALSTVVSDLAAAQAGNTKGLKKYALGLTAAELKTIKFEDVTDKLGKIFAGSAAKGAETFSGQMKILTTAAGEAQETIGKGLVDAFKILAGTKSGIEPITKAMADLSQEVSDTIVGLALFIQKIKDIPVAGKGFSLILENYIDILKRLRPELGLLIDAQEYLSDLAKRQTGTFQVGMSVTGATDFYDSQARAIAKAEADALAKKLAADKKSAAAKIKADKLAAANKAKLDKAAAVFDIQKISIAAALKGKISEEEKIRLLLMQAIEEGNAEKAEVLQKKLEKIQEINAKIAADLLAIGEATDPFAAWVTSLDAAALVLGKMPALLDAAGSLTGRGKVTLPTGDGLPGGSTSIYTPDMTASEIADTATAAADMAVAAAEAAVASVLASEPIVAAIVEAANAATGMTDVVTNAPIVTGSSSMFNPYGTTPGLSSGYGMQAPTIIVNNNGSVIMQDEFIDVVNDAVLASQRFGYGRTPAGAIL
jgi:hypothetical protein